MTAAEVIACCRSLSEYSEAPDAITRTILSPPMRHVHALLGTLMQRLGMTVHVDAAGNLRGLYAGTRPQSGRWMIGSHLDTVRDAGAFDGILGVVLGVAIISRLAGTSVTRSRR